MSVSLRPCRFSGLAGAVATLWLCCAGQAWAGDGGEDLGTLNTALMDLCNTTLPMFGATVPFCPQAPTITQGILQLAAWELVPNEMIGATNSIPLGQRTNAGNPSIPPVKGTPSPITDFPVIGDTLLTLLENQTVLAFISSSPGPAAATQLYDPRADIFFSAVASLAGSSTQAVQPDTLYLFYDDTARTNPTFLPGKTVAQFLLPLVVLNTDNTERVVPTTLQFRVPRAGGLNCSASSVVGNFSGAASGGSRQTLTPAQIGVDCAVVFAPSPLSGTSHAIFEVQVPLVVTPATDPLYFSNPISNVAFSFKTGETGFTPAPATPPLLGAEGMSIGIGPAAVPLGPPPAMGAASAFSFCANLPAGNAANGNGNPPIPSVAAYYAISTVGETLISAAVPSASTSACPF